ncbi:hypothetical protein DEO72_LG4g780 [Vigna unguiculata]|uniref:Uncharacterized protein n=1 Tax=Vigna unguiculata TaxID=3917 RepID=A0A4D6LMR7_VIGUN|nr:hypothetical protein DEO72_LG4g780 [Vigna unguiculata]
MALRTGAAVTEQASRRSCRRWWCSGSLSVAAMADALWRSFAEVQVHGGVLAAGCCAVDGGRKRQREWKNVVAAPLLIEMERCAEQASRRRGADSGEDRRSLP